MESLSSRHLPRKLSNGFSAKNAYDDVFSGPPKLRAQKRVEDYTEIFGGSRASSIPVLDLSADKDPNGVADLRSSKLDYSNIFGNFPGEEIGVSYEDLVANAGPRTPTVTGPPLQNSDQLKFSKENQGFTFDDKKQFNMSYHKTSLGSQDGTSGTIHVAQFQPLPGYTCFVDETTPQNKEADKRDNRLKVDFNEGIPEGKITKKPMSHLDDKQTFGRELKSRSGLSWDGSYANEKLFDAHDINLKSHPSKAGPPSRMAANLENSNGHSVHNINLKSHPSKVRLPSSIAANLENSNGHLKRFMTSYSEAHKNDTSRNDVGGDCSPPLFGEEIDVNSAAAASAAALKDAIQKAQESIRIAKELMQRKKEGLRSCSNWSFKDSLKVKDNRENILAYEGNRTEDKNAEDTHRSMDFSQVFPGWGMNSAVKSGEGVTDFKDNNRTSISGKVMGDAHAKNLDAAEKFEPATWFSTLMNIGKNRTVTSSIEQVVGKFRFGQYMDNHECDTKETMKEEEVIVREEKADEKAHELGEVERKLNSVIMEKESEDNVDKLESVCDACEHEEIEKPGISQEDEEVQEKETGLNRNEDCEIMLKESQQKIEDEITLESHELKENDFEKGQGKAQELVENENELQEVFQQEHVEKTTKEVDEEVDDETFEDASQWVEIDNENELTSEIDVYIVCELDIDEKRPTDGKENEEHFEECELEGNEKGLLGSYRYEETVNTYLETEKIEVIQEANYENDFNSESDAWSHDVSDNISETQEACQPELNHNDLETSQEVDEKENYITASFVQGVVEDSKIGESIKVDFEVRSEDSAPKFGFTDMDFGKTEAEKRDEELELNQKLESGIEILANGFVENGNVLEEDEVTIDEEAENSSPETSDVGKRCIDIMTDLETSHVSNMSQEKEETIEVDEEIRMRQNTEMNEENEDKEMEIDEEMKTSQGKEDNEENLDKLLTMEDDKEIKIAVPNKVLDNEYLRKIDEAKRREREREMDRIAVERAIREARERAFAIAREKAERAAVERANAEVRQRAMAEARGKLEKATTSTKSTAEKASMEAKIRSERAAVERATEEARERALEKALSQKTRPSRDNAMKKSFSSSDLHRSAETNNSTESAPWNKATLERQERIMERTAKALAEKNMRDLLAQKEQAEKNRLAESLDADIKRWSSGKEGNLRALLSTLHYILGPGSGWQPVSLTEIITTTAVKKAYRKATLNVHPDKLQQRGASIQQKYICEKVFDLLKAAWNRFNSEER